MRCQGSIILAALSISLLVTLIPTNALWPRQLDFPCESCVERLRNKASRSFGLRPDIFPSFFPNKRFLIMYGHSPRVYDWPDRTPLRGRIMIRTPARLQLKFKIWRPYLHRPLCGRNESSVHRIIPIADHGSHLRR